MKRIWLIGGTSESRQLAIALSQANRPCTITVTTEPARQLYPSHACLKVIVGKLTPAQLAVFLQAEAIGAIVDASHPFAEEISRLAIAAATEFQIPYLRFERSPIVAPGSSETVLTLSSFEQLFQGNYLTDQRVLLTLGYKALPLFIPWQNKATLFARILPSIEALEVALAAGFSSDRLFGLRPPLSLELERALWQHWQISLVVTKASGAAGGEAIKRSLAEELGISLIVINRPEVSYPRWTNELAIVLEFCQHI
uniref:Precorrin-6x reductase n=1 Tax=Cyanothece sp. (strain PCC 7425 / ATCC 29141) TaxID=395961 RepID=B8HQ30_CYAP4